MKLNEITSIPKIHLATRDRRIVSVSMKIFLSIASLSIYTKALSRYTSASLLEGQGSLSPMALGIFVPCTSRLSFYPFMRRVPVSSLLLAPFPILHYFATLPIVFSPVLPRPSLKTISLVSLSRRSSDLFLLPRVLFSRVA